MKKQDIDTLVETFFSCDNENILRIVGELLATMAAEEHLPLEELMSRNYETAQANPEINTIPGNLKNARDAIFPYFWGTDGWSSKYHLENVRGPANYASLIGSMACLLKNPNLCVDTYSQRSNELEVKAITALANLVFYHTDSPWGVFTMGGTVSNLYAGKLGIEKVWPGAMQKGIRGRKLVGIVSQAAHYCNETLAGWLGIGTRNIRAIETDDTCAMSLEALGSALDELFGSKTLVPFVIATFGTTDAFGIDDVRAVRDVIEAQAKKYDMPVPHLHVDAAAGWALCVLNEYDVKKNPFGVDADALRVIKRLRPYATALGAADSISVDMHKMGWGHYPASAFIVNNRDDLRLLSRTREDMPYFPEADYRRDPALFTLECSRPAIGPYSVMASLNGLGLKGYQLLVAHALELTAMARRLLDKLDYCQVVNAKSLGPSVLFWVLPKGRNASRLFRRLCRGELPDGEYREYCRELRKLYDQRAEAVRGKQEPQISFTTNTGYCPGGRPIPAWKAVFFNPKTDQGVIEQLIQSIKDL